MSGNAFGTPSSRRRSGKGFSSRRKRSHDNQRLRCMRLEQLEDRRLLSTLPLTPTSFHQTAIDDWQTESDSAFGNDVPEYAPGEIILGFGGDTADVFQSRGPVAALTSARALVNGHGLHTPKLLATVAQAENRVGHVITHWQLPAEADVSAMVDRLSAIPGIVYAEPNFVLSSNSLPNDQEFGQLWGLHNLGQTGGTADADIDAPEAWDLATGSGDIVVGIIDSGVDYGHVDLASNMWTNPGEIADDGIDNDGNGYVDDVYGWDFINNDNDPFDDFGHGTHVAGTVAAQANNGLGVAGVNWDAQIMALKFLGANGSGPTSAAVEAVNYATMMRTTYGINVRVTNNSYGGGGESQAMEDAILASGQAGMLFVAAAGNNNADLDSSLHFPASYDLDNMIVVAATDHNDAKADFSSYGASVVDLAAPGVDTLSTLPGNAYGLESGTSMAAPHVAGVAALAWSTAPTATPDFIKTAILAGVDPVASMTDITGTGGRLNALGTLKNTGMAVKSSNPVNGEIVDSPLTSFTIDFSFPVAEATLSASDLTVNTFSADDFVLSDDRLSATFTFDTSPVRSEGLQVMLMPENAVHTTSTIPWDSGLHSWTGTFRYDSVPMRVIATNPAGSGAVVTLPFPQLDVTFNEEYDPNTLGVDDVVLSQGAVVQADPVDSYTVRYSLSGILNEEIIAATIPPAAVTDRSGNPNEAFWTTFELDFGTVAFPSPLRAKEPFGSLVYQTHTVGSIRANGDIDNFTLELEPHQRVTVILEPDVTLQPSVELFASGTSLASSQATGPGQYAVIHAVPTGSNVETFTIAVAGAETTVGDYRLSVFLNTDIEDEAYGGSVNDTLAQAQDMLSVPLGADVQQATVLGTIRAPGFLGPDGFGYYAQAVDFQFEDISQTGTRVLEGEGDDSELLLRKNQLEGFTFDFYGQTYNQVIIGYNGQITFEWDGTSRSNGNNSPSNSPLLNSPGVATIAPLWDDLDLGSIYWELRGDAPNRHLIVQWDRVVQWRGVGEMTFQAILYESDGSLRFNYLDLDDNWPNGGLDSATVGLKDIGTQGPNRLLVNYLGSESAWAGTERSVLIGTSIATTPTPDVYRFTLPDDDFISISLLESTGRGIGEIELLDATGTLVSSTVMDPADVHHAIQTFAPSGEYFVRVTGGLSAEYSLTVTRGAHFDLEPNSLLSDAQSIAGGGAVVGALMSDVHFASSGRVGLHEVHGITFGPDGNAYLAGFHQEVGTIIKHDGTTGRLIDGFAASGTTYAGTPIFGPDGYFYAMFGGQSNLARFDAADGTYLGRFASVTNGRDIAFGPDGNIYVSSSGLDKVVRIDSVTGEIIDDFVPAGSGGLDRPFGITFGPDSTGDGIPELYVAALEPSAVYRYNGSTGDFQDIFVASGSNGLSGARALVFGTDETGDGVPELYVSSTFNDRVLRFDGLTGEPRGVAVSQGSGGLDLPGELTFGPDGSLYVTSGGTQQVLRFLTPTRDVYQVSLAAGEQLVVTTSTPLGALNGFDPAIQLRHSSGMLIDEDDNSADGRNATLTFTASSGEEQDYFIEVVPSAMSSNGTSGEYVLQVDIVSVPLPPGITASTSSLVTAEPSLSDSFTLVLNTDPGEGVVVDVAVASTNVQEGVVAPVTVSFIGGAMGNWDTAQSIVVTGQDDDVDDGDVPYEITIQTTASDVDSVYHQMDVNSIVALNLDDDTAAITITPTSIVTREDGSTAGFFVALESQPRGGVSLDFSSSDLSEGTIANAVDNKLTLTFTEANWSVAQPVDVVGVDDLQADGDVAYSILVGVQSSDEIYGTMNVAPVSAINEDDDLGPPISSLAISNFAAKEGNGGLLSTQFVFTVARTGDTSGAVTVDFVTLDGSAIAGEDYAAHSGTLSFAVQETSKTITVLIHGDLDYESTETFGVELSGATGGATIDNALGIGTIRNDDRKPRLTGDFNAGASGATLDVSQAQEALAFAITLWSTHTEYAMPSDIQLNVTDLPAGQLGEAYRNHISLDINANGVGWFMDLSSPSTGRVDLLTVVAHEVGHVLGLGHSDLPDDLMAATLPIGTRRLPDGNDSITTHEYLTSVAKPMSLFADIQLGGARRELYEYALMADAAEVYVVGDPDNWPDSAILIDPTEVRATRTTVEICELLELIDEESGIVEETLLDLIANRRP